MSPALALTRNILVIEDERDIAELIALHLSDLPAQITLASDGPGGLQLALRKPWDAIVLDIRLPGLNGLDLCREVRAQTAWLPILMLTARSGELDRVLGLELGADDYLTKPFSVLELQARVKALLRRASVTAARAAEAAAHTASPLQHGRLKIDRVQRGCADAARVRSAVALCAAPGARVHAQRVAVRRVGPWP
jgi:DNA-binding response OmpR family regulator